MYASRSETLISILKYLFSTLYCQLQFYKLLQICENENSSLESKSLLHINGCGTWFILICNLLSYYLQFHKTCNISNSGEQKYISQMFTIYKLCLAETCKVQIISLILLENFLLVLSFLMVCLLLIG